MCSHSSQLLDTLMRKIVTEGHLGTSLTSSPYGFVGIAQGSVGSLTIFDCQWAWRMRGKGKTIECDKGFSQSTIYVDTESSLSLKKIQQCNVSAKKKGWYLHAFEWTISKHWQQRIIVILIQSGTLCFPGIKEIMWLLWR